MGTLTMFLQRRKGPLVDRLVEDEKGKWDGGTNTVAEELGWIPLHE
jgi:hypothetical protein